MWRSARMIQKSCFVWWMSLDRGMFLVHFTFLHITCSFSFPSLYLLVCAKREGGIVLKFLMIAHEIVIPLQLSTVHIFFLLHFLLFYFITWHPYFHHSFITHIPRHFPLPSPLLLFTSVSSSTSFFFILFPFPFSFFSSLSSYLFICSAGPLE